MIFFIITFIITGITVLILDDFFYRTIYKILNTQNINSLKVLNSLGYYNKSIFSSRIYEIILIFTISLLIFMAHLYFIKKKDRDFKNKINKLYLEVQKINQGDYKQDILKEDEFSVLRDEIYKIVVSLKSLEEDSRQKKISLKNDLSNIAHQLKTPITSIGFMSELIQMDSENTKTYIEKLNKELDRLSNFTEILLKLSKVESDTIKYKKEKISIREIIEDVINRINSKKQIDVKYTGDDIEVLGDDVWLYESFLNILNNSLNYAKSTVEVKFSENPIFKEVVIKDDGPGLDKETIKKIFNRFYRSNESMPGYGIGLNLSKIIIENHGGEIHAQNNNGMEFKIKFYNVT